MGSNDDPDDMAKDRGDGDGGRSLNQLYQVLVENIGQQIPRDRVRIVGRDPLEAVINDSERAIIRDDGQLNYWATFRPIATTKIDRSDGGQRDVPGRR